MRAGASLAAALLLAGSLATAAAARADDDPWPMERRDPRASASCAWPEGPSVPEWHWARLAKRKYRDGVPVWASPALAVVEGRPFAYIGGCDHALHALDLAAKEVAWSKVTNGPVASAPAVGLLDGAPVVFFASSDRTVYACAARDGARVWSRELFEPTTTMGDALFASPMLHEGRLFVAGFAHDRAVARSLQTARLFVLEAATGRLLATVEASQGPVSSPVGRVVRGRLLVWVVARKGQVTCFDATDAVPVPRWRAQMPHEVLGSPCVATAGGRSLLFLGSKYGNLIAMDAWTGDEVWKRMAGNWIDNTVAVGEVDGRAVVYAGSHDYKVHAFDAATGEVRWSRSLGGEVYAAPALFRHAGRPALATCCLDNHAYVLDAATGDVLTSYFTGSPLWDKVSKGDVLWGSPAVLEGTNDEAVVVGSYSGTVFVLPVAGECSLRTQAWSPSSLWWGLLVTAVLFLGIVVPVVLRGRSRASDA